MLVGLVGKKSHLSRYELKLKDPFFFLITNLFWYVDVAFSFCTFCLGWVVVCAFLFSWLGQQFMLRMPSLSEWEGNMLLCCRLGGWDG